MSSRPIVIGSRGSDLALWQAHHVEGRLKALGKEVEIKIIKTQGDLIQHLSFDKMEGKGFFTKEIEAELLQGNIDLAVHSHKDLETTNPPGLTIAGVSDRAALNDVLLISPSHFDTQRAWPVKEGALIGTSSARRKVQLLHRRPDLRIGDIRGNVPTRIDKLRKGQFDAIVLAQAGLDRLSLDLGDLHVYRFDPTDFIPAPAQGVLAYQIRTDDTYLHEVLKHLHHPEVAEEIGVEREVLRRFQGGCQLPLGAYCRRIQGKLELHTMMAPRWDATPVYAKLSQNEATSLAERAVESLRMQGAQ